MKILILAVLFCGPIFNEVQSLKIPSLSFCKKTCKSNADCNSGIKCSKIFFCKTKTCFGKLPKPTVKPTTTPTTPAPTTLPPNTCPPPKKGEFMSFRCFSGHKKNGVCIASCTGNYCTSGLSLTRCSCSGGKCSWTRDVSNICKPKSDKCESNADCSSPEICTQRSCGKICYKRFVPSCPIPCTSGKCPSGYSCTKQICGLGCERQIVPCKDECNLKLNNCKLGTCKLTACGTKCLPNSLPGQCSNPCSKLGTCALGYICRAEICGMQCVRSIPCKDECSVKLNNCKIGTCQLTSCGTKCRPKPLPGQCSNPCSKLRMCAIGYTCRAEICGMQCVRSSPCKDECNVKLNNCKIGTCQLTSCGARCHPNPPPGQCSNPCSKLRMCRIGYACRAERCGMQCVRLSTGLCQDECHVKLNNCKIGTCQLTNCGARCRPSPLPGTCSKPCSKLGTCAPGYTCTPDICGMQCVRSNMPSCAIPDPMKLVGLQAKCHKFCKVGVECGLTEVCCYSAQCRANVCQEKTNNCSVTETGKCFTDAQCMAVGERCVIHNDGCKKCTKVAIPQLLPCRGQLCASDSSCKSGEKCLTHGIGCKVCTPIL